MKPLIKIRKLEKQFECSMVEKIRNIQVQLNSIKTKNEVMHYFVFEIMRTLESGLLLSSLQIACSFLEYLIRYMVITNRVSSEKLNPNYTDIEVEYEITKQVEDIQKLSFTKMINELVQKGIITSNENTKLETLYQRIRIPVHHAIIGRYVNSYDENKLINEIFCTINERDFENTIENYSISELETICSFYKLLFSKINT